MPKPALGRTGLRVFAAGFLVAGALHAQPFTSPSGTWDCLLSGAHTGIAFLTFQDSDNSGGTVSGYEIIVPRRAAPIRPNFTGFVPFGHTNELGARTNAFGYTTITGRWAFTTKGRITGFLNEADSLLMNEVNFTGKVAANKRLTLLERSPFGRVTARGIPTNSVPNITGSWQGIRRGRGQSSLEFFTIGAFETDTNAVSHTNEVSSEIVTNGLAAPPFGFLVQGQGAGYTNAGVALISAHKRIGIVTEQFSEADGAFQTLRAVTGGFNPRHTTAVLSGVEAPGEFSADRTNRISFRIQKQAGTGVPSAALRP